MLVNEDVYKCSIYAGVLFQKQVFSRRICVPKVDLLYLVEKSPVALTITRTTLQKPQTSRFFSHFYVQEKTRIS